MAATVKVSAEPETRTTTATGSSAATIVTAMEPVRDTLTGRILQSLQRRRDFGQPSRVIYVTDEGFHQIEREHGLENDGIDISLRGVPVHRCTDIHAGEFWILASR
jgi:hypothetical protein